MEEAPQPVAVEKSAKPKTAFWILLIAIFTVIGGVIGFLIGNTVPADTGSPENSEILPTVSVTASPEAGPVLEEYTSEEYGFAFQASEDYTVTFLEDCGYRVMITDDIGVDIVRATSEPPFCLPTGFGVPCAASEDAMNNTKKLTYTLDTQAGSLELHPEVLDCDLEDPALDGPIMAQYTMLDTPWVSKKGNVGYFIFKDMDEGEYFYETEFNAVRDELFTFMETISIDWAED